MEAQIGFVDSLEGELAYVSFATRGECEKCGACSGGKGGGRLLARNDAGASVGDRVRVESSGRAMIAIAFVVFALPICALFAGLGAGSLVAAAVGANAAAVGGVGAALAFAAAVAAAIAYDRRSKKESSTVVRIVDVLGPSMEAELC